MSRILYKYLPQSRSSVLLDGMIRFSQVGALNDPFESRALCDFSEATAQLLFNMNRELDELVASYGSESLTADDIALARKAKEQLEQRIRSLAAPERFGREVMRLMNTSLGILSLSRTAKSLLLWAHYAEGHAGFVIGLEDSDPFFSLPAGDGTITKSHDVLYRTKRLTVPEGVTGMDAYQLLLCQKSEVWKYEEEVRVFRVLKPETSLGKDAQGYQVHLFPLSQMSIREVIFGANSSPSLRARLIRYLKLHRIDAKIFRARISDSSFDLHFDELSLRHYEYLSSSDISYRFTGCEFSLQIEVHEILEPQNLTNLRYDMPMASVAAIIGLGRE